MVVDIEDDKEVSETKRDDAYGGNKERPEVETAVSLESREAEDDQFKAIVPGNADETGHGGDLSESFSIRRFEKVEVAAGEFGAQHWGIFSVRVEDVDVARDSRIWGITRDSRNVRVTGMAKARSQES